MRVCAGRHGACDICIPSGEEIALSVSWVSEPQLEPGPSSRRATRALLPTKSASRASLLSVGAYLRQGPVTCPKVVLIEAYRFLCSSSFFTPTDGTFLRSAPSARK